MAGSVTKTEIIHASAKKLVLAWTSDGSGNADATTAKVYDGKIVGLATIPSGGGTAPTDNYDVVLTDAQGHDVLLGAGANRDTAITEYVNGDSLAAVAGSALTLGITNAGAAKQGTVIVWVR